MPIWSRLINIRYAIVDVEVGLKNHKIHDIGALRHDGATYHKASKKELFEFLSGTDYICGHNIIPHDAKYSQTKHANGFWPTRFIYLLCCFRNVLTISF